MQGTRLVTNAAIKQKQPDGKNLHRQGWSLNYSPDKPPNYKPKFYNVRAIRQHFDTRQQNINLC